MLYKPDTADKLALKELIIREVFFLENPATKINEDKCPLVHIPYV
jgi:hypothetical protein